MKARGEEVIGQSPRAGENIGELRRTRGTHIYSGGEEVGEYTLSIRFIASFH